MYFIDIALPEARIGIEFDGRGKYGSDVDSVHRSIEAEERRQRYSKRRAGGSAASDGGSRPPR